MVRPRFALLIGPLAAVVTASLLLAPPAAADDTSAEGAASTPPAAAQPSATIGDFRPVENADGILVPAEVVTMAPLQAQRDPVNTDCRSAKGFCLQLTRSTTHHALVLVRFCVAMRART